MLNNPSATDELLKDLGLLKKSSNSLGRLSTVVEPLGSLLSVDLDVYGIGERVVVTDLFDESTVTGRSLVCNYYSVEGVLLGTKSLKSDFYCHFSFPPKMIVFIFLFFIFKSEGKLHTEHFSLAHAGKLLHHFLHLLKLLQKFVYVLNGRTGSVGYTLSS